MQDATNGPAEPQGLEPTAQAQPMGTLQGETPGAGTPSSQQPGSTGAKPRMFLPQRGLYYAVIAGFSLITFLVGLIASYPGTLVVNRMTPGSLVIWLLLLCLWSIGGGLVSLLGTWAATVRHPQYMRLADHQG